MRDVLIYSALGFAGYYLWKGYRLRKAIDRLFAQYHAERRTMCPHNYNEQGLKPRPQSVCTVFPNFIGWLMIVGFYSMTIRWMLYVLEHGQKLWVLLAPVLAIFCSCILVVICQYGLETLYPLVGEPVVFAALALTLFGLVAVRWGADPSSSQPPDRFPTAMVLTMHGLLLAVLLATGTHLEVPELLVVMPLAAMTSVLGFHYRAVPSP